jgi:hypothetical protein
LMEVLHERHLSLSRKKSRMGCINEGFHFLGIDYLPTRTEDNTNVTHVNDDSIILSNVHYLNGYGGVRQHLITKSMGQCALFHIQEHCVKHASKLNIWSLLGPLPAGSDIIFIAGLCGGQ